MASELVAREESPNGNLEKETTGGSEWDHLRNCCVAYCQ